MRRVKGNSALLVVDALCADYSRRRELLLSGRVEHRTALELRYLNFKILEAAAEIVGERDAEIMISEIGANTGYARSKLFYMSESLYKTRKGEVIYNIARHLHLID